MEVQPLSAYEWKLRVHAPYEVIVIVILIVKERREASSEVGPCHAGREAGICITLVLVDRDTLSPFATYVGVAQHRRESHPARAPTPLVPCSGPTSRGVPESELRMRKLKLEKRAHAAPRSCYHDGTLVRGSTGLHTHCGSDACSASPCGDRTTTAQRRSLEAP